jgi:hypothetical protein
MNEATYRVVDKLFCISSIVRVFLYIKTKNKNGKSGALNRTNTPNSPDVYPAKKPSINEKTIDAISNSLFRIILAILKKLFVNKSRSVNSKNSNDSKALIRTKILSPSHR